jgi:DNA (cytosine-5)-methyltransferase 1
MSAPTGTNVPDPNDTAAAAALSVSVSSRRQPNEHKQRPMRTTKKDAHTTNSATTSLSSSQQGASKAGTHNSVSRSRGGGRGRRGRKISNPASATNKSRVPPLTYPCTAIAVWPSHMSALFECLTSPTISATSTDTSTSSSPSPSPSSSSSSSRPRSESYQSQEWLRGRRLHPIGERAIGGRALARTTERSALRAMELTDHAIDILLRLCPSLKTNQINTSNSSSNTFEASLSSPLTAASAAPFGMPASIDSLAVPQLPSFGKCQTDNDIGSLLLSLLRNGIIYWLPSFTPAPMPTRFTIPVVIDPSSPITWLSTPRLPPKSTLVSTASPQSLSSSTATTTLPTSLAEEDNMDHASSTPKDGKTNGSTATSATPTTIADGSINGSIIIDDVNAISTDRYSFRYVELFAGIGGFRIALDELGGTCVLSSEIEPVACSTYATHFGEAPVGDIYEINASSIPSHDLLVGGFPCQSFSSIGEQKGFADARGQLFWQIIRIVRHHHPRALLLENVPGLVRLDDGDALRVILSQLSSEGYHVTYGIYNSSKILAQARKRLYIIAIRNDLTSQKGFHYDLPLIPSLNRVLSDIIEPHDSIPHEYILKDSVWQRIRATALYREHPSYKLASLDGVSSTLISGYRTSYLTHAQFIPHQPSPPMNATTLEVSQSIPPSSSSSSSSSPSNPRWLTARESARLQGFPEHYAISCGVRAWYRLIGNAVSPPIIAILASSILSAIDDNISIIGYITHSPCACDFF